MASLVSPGLALVVGVITSKLYLEKQKQDRKQHRNDVKIREQSVSPDSVRLILGDEAQDVPLESA